MSNKRSKNTHAPTDVQTGRCTHTRACMHSDAIMMDSDLGTQEYLKAALKEMERRKARQINKVLLFFFNQPWLCLQSPLQKPGRLNWSMWEVPFAGPGGLEWYKIK